MRKSTEGATAASFWVFLITFALGAGIALWASNAGWMTCAAILLFVLLVSA
jgi:hypothetical protein